MTNDITMLKINHSNPWHIFLHNRRMWVTDLFGAIHVGALFVIVAAFPVILDANTTFRSARKIGIGMLALTIPLITLHLLAHRFREQYKLTRPLETLIGCTLIVLSMVWWFTAASRHPTYIMVLPSLVFMGSGFGMIRLFGHMGIIKETGQRWASTLLRHSDLQQPCRRRHRCDRHRFCPAGYVDPTFCRMIHRSLSKLP